MNNQDYEQKKRECWEEFKRTNLDGEVQWQPVSRYDVFCAAFDRAFALGKQEKDAEDTVISGWAARHGNGPNVSGLRIYTVKPKRIVLLKMWDGHGEKSVLIDHRFFPDLTWDSDPEPVEITIKRKKK